MTRRLRPVVARAGREDGAVAVLVAVMSVLLFASAALVIDLGNGRALRRKAQTAVDAAAFAGVRSLADNPAGVAGSYVTANGFGSSTVNIPPASGSRSGDPTCVEVIAHEDVDTLFAGVLGFDSITVRARAVACASQGSGGGVAIFANSPTCHKAIEWSGSTTHVTGGVHTNNDLHVGGQTNVVRGPTTYLTNIQAPPDKVDFNPVPVQLTSTKPYPVDFEIPDFAPGGAKAALATAQGRYHDAGNAKIDKGWLESRGLFNNGTGVLAPGLYYTTNDIDLSASQVHGTGVTFVAGGPISFSGSQQELSPWDPEGLLAFSNHEKPGSSHCNEAGVRLNGSSHEWTGIVFAPRSLIEMSGSSNTTFHGSLIANTVKLNGSTLNITYNDDFGAGVPTYKLVE